MVFAMNIADPNSNPLAKIASLSTILNVVIPLLMTIAGLVFLFMLISGGFKYITSGDSPEQVKKAQSTFVTAVIGLLIVVSSFIIVKLLAYFFHVDVMIQ